MSTHMNHTTSGISHANSSIPLPIPYTNSAHWIPHKMLFVFRAIFSNAFQGKCGWSHALSVQIKVWRCTDGDLSPKLIMVHFDVYARVSVPFCRSLTIYMTGCFTLKCHSFPGQHQWSTARWIDGSQFRVLHTLPTIASNPDVLVATVVNPEPLFTERYNVLPPNLTKSQSCYIGCCHDRIVPTVDRQPGSTAAEVPVKFQSDWKSLNQRLWASRLHEIFCDFISCCENTWAGV